MKANFVSTLVYFDGPQVALLRYRKMHIIAVAVEKEGFEYPFFCCLVRKHHWEKYYSGKADLYYLFSSAKLGNFYFFDWNSIESNKKVLLTKASHAESVNKDYWPDRGFFSVAHTENIRENPTTVSSQIFNIDGNWSTSDFSSFYGKMSDTYAIFIADDEFSSDNDTVCNKIKNNVLSRLWRGGGSYSGFYDSLEQNVPSMDPLQVSRIHYSSPGIIELRGRRDTISEMLKAFSNFGDKLSTTESLYNLVNSTLSDNNLKKARPDAQFPTREMETSVKLACDELLQAIEINQTPRFFEACNNNVLLYSKLSMSIYRRFKGVHSFIVEGRIDPA